MKKTTGIKLLPILVLFKIGLFFSSCSFNRMFLAPDPIPATTRRFQLNSGNDTVLVTIENKQFQPQFFNQHQEPVHQLFTLESVVFDSESGNRLNGWWLYPERNVAHTTLVHFHGNAGNLFSQYQALLPLVDYGYQIFIFDYSGFGFSTGKASRKNVLKDGFSGFRYAREHAYAQGMPLVLYGQSLGGHLSAVVAAEKQAELDALVIEGAFSSHHDIGAYYAKKMFGMGFLARVFIREMYSAKKSLPRYKKPLLVVHSTEDEVVPFEFGKKIYEAGNDPKEFFEIRYPHICGPTFYAQEISERIRAMLK